MIDYYFIVPDDTLLIYRCVSFVRNLSRASRQLSQGAALQMQRLVVHGGREALTIHRQGLQHLAAQVAGRRSLKVDVQAGATAR